MDFADETLKLEHLTVKFKLEETVNEFKRVFQQCQDELRKHPTPTKQEQNGNKVRKLTIRGRFHITF